MISKKVTVALQVLSMGFLNSALGMEAQNIVLHYLKSEKK